MIKKAFIFFLCITSLSFTCQDKKTHFVGSKAFEDGLIGISQRGEMLISSYLFNSMSYDEKLTIIPKFATYLGSHFETIKLEFKSMETGKVLMKASGFTGWKVIN